MDHVREIKFLLANGFDFVTDVVHTSAEKPGDVPGVLDFEEVADLNTRMWAQRRRTAASNYIPFVTTGCNDYPLRRDSAEIIENRTPEEFGKLCKSAARFIAVNKAPFFLIGHLNDFDRGASIEPNSEDGFPVLRGIARRSDDSRHPPAAELRTDRAQVTRPGNPAEKLRGRAAGVLPEYRTEVVAVGESAAPPHSGDRMTRRLQRKQQLRLPDAPFRQELPETPAVRGAADRTSQMVRIHPQNLRQIGERRFLMI